MNRTDPKMSATSTQANPRVQKQPVDMVSQRLRILRCTARSLAEGLGGLRFKAGTRPWLDGLQRLGAGAACAHGRHPQLAGDRSDF